MAARKDIYDANDKTKYLSISDLKLGDHVDARFDDGKWRQVKIISIINNEITIECDNNKYHGFLNKLIKYYIMFFFFE